jgi:hypothetical protein
MTNKDPKKRISGREFLGVSSTAAIGAVAGAGVLG